MEAVGYDMGCRISARFETLLKAKVLKPEHAKCWQILNDLLFIDRFHVKNHTEEKCITGIFNPDNPKFGNIVTKKKVNTQVVEQGWAKINNFKFLKRCYPAKIRYYLFAFKMFNNETKLKELKSKGWDLKAIQRIGCLRNFNDDDPMKKKSKNGKLKQLKYT